MSITTHFTSADAWAALGVLAVLFAVAISIAVSVAIGFLCDFLVEAIKTHHKD